VLALDAKINFDDNALERHPELNLLRDLGEEDPLEVEASKSNLNYIKLEGMSAAWSTVLDWRWGRWTSSNWRGEPANFLDVGGGRVRKRSNRFRSYSQIRM